MAKSRFAGVIFMIFLLISTAYAQLGPKDGAGLSPTVVAGRDARTLLQQGAAQCEDDRQGERARGVHDAHAPQHLAHLVPRPQTLPLHRVRLHRLDCRLPAHHVCPLGLGHVSDEDRRVAAA